jgi:hypothetical protein
MEMRNKQSQEKKGLKTTEERNGEKFSMHVI